MEKKGSKLWWAKWVQKTQMPFGGHVLSITSCSDNPALFWNWSLASWTLLCLGQDHEVPPVEADQPMVALLPSYWMTQHFWMSDLAFQVGADGAEKWTSEFLWIGSTSTTGRQSIIRKEKLNERCLYALSRQWTAQGKGPCIAEQVALWLTAKEWFHGNQSCSVTSYSLSLYFHFLSHSPGVKPPMMC